MIRGDADGAEVSLLSQLTCHVLSERLRLHDLHQRAEGQDADHHLGLVVSGVADPEQVGAPIQPLHLLFKVGEMQHDPLQRVAVVGHPQGQEIVLRLPLLAIQGLFPRIVDTGSHFSQIHGGDRAPACGDDAELIVLFGILEADGMASDEHGVALAVGHFEFDLGAAAHGLQHHAELSDVLLVLKGVSAYSRHAISVGW